MQRLIRFMGTVSVDTSPSLASRLKAKAFVVFPHSSYIRIGWCPSRQRPLRPLTSAVEFPPPRRIIMTEPTSATRKRYVTGLFNDRASAERAYEAVSERGYTRDDVNLVMSDDTRKRYFSGDQAVTTELGTKAAEGAGIGAGI